MKWPGISGVGGQEPLIKGPLVACILLLLAQPHHCARPNTHPPHTAGTIKLRPERAALTPPTVTSLRPPDKGNVKHAVGLTVRGGQSSSNSPPVVASLSPSSTTYSSYPHHTIQQVTHQHQPTSPIATAASGSRSGVSLNGQRLLRNHQQTLSVTQSIPAPSLHGIRVSSGPSAASSSYRSTHPRATINNRYSQYAGVSSGRAVPEPNSQTSQSTGGWADMETEALGVLWEEAGTDVTKRKRMMMDDHLPSTSERQDTFGHIITEDFTHLESKNAPHARADDIYSSLTETGHLEHSSQTNAYSQEEVVEADSDGLNPYWQQYNITDTSRSNSGRDFSSHEISSGIYNRGYKPRDYSQQRHIIHDQMRNNSPDNPPTYKKERKITKQNSTPTTVIPNRTLRIIEVARLKNMTEVGDLLQFLKRKGITMNKLLAFLRNKPTRQAILDFLNSPDVSATTLSPTTHEPQLPEKSFKGSPTHLPQSDEDHEETLLRGTSYLSTKSGETSNIHLVSKSNSNTSFSDDNRKTPLSASQQYGLDKAESLTTEDEQKGHQNKKRKNKGRRRKNKGKKNKRQRGRKGKSKNQPDLVYTTAILPTERDVNDTDILETKLTAFPETSSTALPTSTVPMLSTVKSGISDSTETILFIQTPTVTMPPVITTEPSLAVPTSLPNSTQVNFSIQDPTPTFMPEDPAHKTSEVSILSVSVMEVPRNETGKRSGDETIPEYSKPMRKRPKYHKPHHDMHESYNGRFKTPRIEHNRPEHNSFPTIKQTEKEIERRTNFVTEQQKDDYILPIKGILIISGVMGALAVFTLVVLISYAVIKCSKKPVVNNYQVSEQKPTA